MKVKNKEDAKIFECHNCVLLKFDPFNKVKRDIQLIPPFIINNGVTYEKEFTVTDRIMNLMENSNDMAGIEIRCVMIDGIRHE